MSTWRIPAPVSSAPSAETMRPVPSPRPMRSILPRPADIADETRDGARQLLRGAFEDEFAHACGVGLALHGPHDGADDRTGGLPLAVAALREDVGLRCPRLIARGQERPVAGEHTQPAGPAAPLSPDFPPP